MTTTDWPYDADQGDPLTELRIPVVCSHPRWCYLAAFDRDSEARPTDGEARMLASFLQEYIERWYGNGSFRARLAERPFDIDGGANGLVFHKWAVDDWGYRRRTWQTGPVFWPGGPWLASRRGPLSLDAVFDHIHSFGDRGPAPRWVAWKAAHPDVFHATTKE
jgi:hypothetical protein